MDDRTDDPKITQDTSSARYDKTAADLAWSRTIEFFKETLA